MNIDVVCVGTLKEKYWKAAVEEYSTRLSKYGKLQIVQVKEAPDIIKEGKTILGKIKERSYVIALDVKGKSLPSEGLAKKMASLALSGKSHITFIIGGSDGLSDDVLSRADYRLSFSEMTFPHQMMRVILLEQVYRAYKINNNETYHK